VIKPDGEHLDYTEFIGESFTNNHAEYKALILGLTGCQNMGARRVEAFGDSMLVCKQMKGSWKVKAAQLMPLVEQAKKLAASFDSFDIQHIYRDKNSEADGLANRAIDQRFITAASS
jgi:ribonuclease HI